MKLLHCVRQAWRWLLPACCMALGPLQAQAAYPEKPIRIVVGYPAGGATDVAARLVGNKLSERLGQPVVIENKPGSAGNIGADAVVKAPADGYTLLFGTISLAVNGSLYQKLSYDAVRDLRPVGMVSLTPFMLVANVAAPYQSVQELLQQARARSAALNYASAGNGSGSHLFMELMLNKADIEMTHVPYRGAAPAMNDVLGNQVPVTFDNIITTLPLVHNGKLRALAVSTARRSRVAPEVPTLDESGVAGFDASAWFGIFAPQAVPAEVTRRLSQELAAVVQDPDVGARLLQMGAEPVSMSSEAFGQFFRNEVSKWKEVVTVANIKVE